MAVNKVVYAGNTLVDLTGDTITAADLKAGVTAHDKSGAAITGTFTGSGDSTGMPEEYSLTIMLFNTLVKSKTTYSLATLELPDTFTSIVDEYTLSGLLQKFNPLSGIASLEVANNSPYTLICRATGANIIYNAPDNNATCYAEAGDSAEFCASGDASVLTIIPTAETVTIAIN